MIFRVGARFSFSAEVYTRSILSGVIWGIYFLATFTQIVTQKDIKRVFFFFLILRRMERSTGMRSLHPPHETPIRRPGSVISCVLSFFCFSSTVQPFSAWWLPAFEFIANTASHVGVNNTAYISRRYWANGPTGWAIGMFFSRGEGGDDTTVSIYIVYIYIQIAQQSSSRQRCWKVVAFGISYYSSARYIPISEAASLHFLCCCPFWSVLLSLNFLFVDNQRLSFLTYYFLHTAHCTCTSYAS